jgi:excisionase family DNA binding protein
MTDDRAGGRGHLKFHTIGGIARQLEVSARSVHRWVAEGKLIVHRMGRSVRISEADFKTFLAAHRDDE